MKPFLVFYADNGSREACSVYYSWLVLDVATADNAVAKVAAAKGIDSSLLEAIDMGGAVV